MKKVYSILLTFLLGFLVGCNPTGGMGGEHKILLIDGAVNPEYNGIAKATGVDGDFVDLFQNFSIRSVQSIIKKTPKNIVISPISYYMSLALLAEMTNGTSFNEIASALGMSSLDYIRNNTKNLFENHFDTKSKDHRVLMGNSIWIDDEFTVKEQLLQDLAAYFYTLSYQGDLQSSSTAKKIKEWVDNMTGNLIKDPVDEYLADDGTVLSLFSTIYLRAVWQNQFEGSTRKPFYLEDGSNLDVKYLTGEETAFFGEHFDAVLKGFVNGYKMHFVLPKEGLTPFDLLADDILFDQIINLSKYESGEEFQSSMVKAFIPEFGFKYETGLIEPTKDLGIKDIFNEVNNGFKKVNDLFGLFVSSYKQTTYLEIDKTGIKAASVTSIGMKATSAPTTPDTIIEFNRPFLFLITDGQNLPLFIGVLNNPKV